MKKLASNSTWKKLTLAPGPTTLWQTEVEIVEAVGDFFYWGASKSLQMLTAAIKVKDTCTLERKPWETQKAYLKAETSLCRQRPYSESYGLPSSHVLGSVSESWWRRQWHPTPVLSPEKSHGRRSLVGCCPWGREELDMTEWLYFHFPLSCIGEGNGNPLQCSCLENPRNGGAWWAAVYGVAQSWTRLEQLSSSSSNESWTIKKTEHWRSDTFK